MEVTLVSTCKENKRSHSDDLFCAKTLEQLVPSDHRWRQLRLLVDEAL
jgi:hypothetical protein